tara:strand:+ start:3625 stop:4002 length:378 start_codon:yes stop_codon:yes gene_type:complete
MLIMSNWKRRKNYNGKNKNYSIVNKLRKERKSTDEFEIMLNSLSLEEVIALKLELSSRSLSNRMYGVPLWKNLLYIVQDAVLKYALSATRTQAEAMRMLGLNESYMHDLKKKYKTEDYFIDEEDK